jgi:hypothetical protein
MWRFRSSGIGKSLFLRICPPEKVLLFRVEIGRLSAHMLPTFAERDGAIRFGSVMFAF